MKAVQWLRHNLASCLLQSTTCNSLLQVSSWYPTIWKPLSNISSATLTKTRFAWSAGTHLPLTQRSGLGSFCAICVLIRCSRYSITKWVNAISKILCKSNGMTTSSKASNSVATQLSNQLWTSTKSKIWGRTKSSSTKQWSGSDFSTEREWMALKTNSKRKSQRRIGKNT